MPSIDPASQGAYDRGIAAGKIDQRLAGHDEHFKAINGTLSTIAESLEALRLQTQRLADDAVASKATEVVKASALKEADETRHRSETQRWEPWQRKLAIIVAIASVVGVTVAVIVSILNTF